MMLCLCPICNCELQYKKDYFKIEEYSCYRLHYRLIISFDYRNELVGSETWIWDIDETESQKSIRIKKRNIKIKELIMAEKKFSWKKYGF